MLLFLNDKQISPSICCLSQHSRTYKKKLQVKENTQNKHTAGRREQTACWEGGRGKERGGGRIDWVVGGTIGTKDRDGDERKQVVYRQLRDESPCVWLAAPQQDMFLLILSQQQKQWQQQ